MPGGFGAAEAAITAGLIAMGVDESTAFAIAITQRICTLLPASDLGVCLTPLAGSPRLCLIRSPASGRAERTWHDARQAAATAEGKQQEALLDRAMNGTRQRGKASQFVARGLMRNSVLAASSQW